jgi:hypothetical protein
MVMRYAHHPHLLLKQYLELPRVWLEMTVLALTWLSRLAQREPQIFPADMTAQELDDLALVFAQPLLGSFRQPPKASRTSFDLILSAQELLLTARAFAMLRKQLAIRFPDGIPYATLFETLHDYYRMLALMNV